MTTHQDKATVRPWQFGGTGSMAIFCKKTGAEICVLNCAPNKYDGEATANAALIVQAVNEHAALVAVADAGHALMMTPGAEKLEVPHYKLAVAIRDLARVRESGVQS